MVDANTFKANLSYLNLVKNGRVVDKEVYINNYELVKDVDFIRLYRNHAFRICGTTQILDKDYCREILKSVPIEILSKIMQISAKRLESLIAPLSESTKLKYKYKMKNECNTYNIATKVCPVCGKTFIPAKQHIYRDVNNRLVCSYSCSYKK